MKANEFLKKVIESLGMFLGPNDEVLFMVPGNDGEFISDNLVSKTGYPYLLPTNKNMKRLIKVEGNKVELEYLPFNPISEDDVGRDTQAFKSYLKRMQQILTLESFEAGLGMLAIAKDDKAISNKGVRIEKFLTTLGSHITTKNMKIVDDTTIKTFKDMVKNCKDVGNKPLLKLMVKRRGEINGKIYPVVTSIYYPLMETIMQLESGEEAIVNDVKLRKKDVIVFKELFTSLCSGVDETFVYRVGSLREDYPMFDSSYRLYLDIMTKNKDILKRAESIMPSSIDPCSAVISLRSDEIDSILTEISKEISRIPTEKFLSAEEYKSTPEVEEIQPTQFNLPQTNNNQQPTQQHQPQYQQPQNQSPQAYGGPLIPVDTYGNPIGPIPSGYRQQYGYNTSIPQIVNTTPYNNNTMVNAVSNAMNPWATQPTMSTPYNPLTYGQQPGQYIISNNPYGNSGLRPPMGLTGDSDFRK